MRLFTCVMSLTLLLFTPAPQPLGTFPIPADMHETWPGAKPTDADRLLLREAVESDLRGFDRNLQEDQRPKFESVDTADLDLGLLGKGVLVTLSESILGGTGGCPCRYSGRNFISQACDNMTAIEGAPSGRSRFDPAAVVLSTCGTQAP